MPQGLQSEDKLSVYLHFKVDAVDAEKLHVHGGGFGVDVLTDPFIDTSVDTMSFVPYPPCNDDLMSIKVRATSDYCKFN